MNAYLVQVIKAVYIHGVTIKIRSDNLMA